MTTQSRLALLSALVATPVFGAPFLAIGDNAELFLTARAEARYEDNITFSPDFASFKQEDEVFEFVPGAELLFGKSSLTSGSLVLKERFVVYSDNTQFNDELFSAAFNSKFEGAKLKLVTSASFTEKLQNSREELGGDRLVRRDVTALGASGEWAATEKTKLGLGVSYAKTKYKTPGFIDRETYIVPLNYYFAISPKLDLSAGFQYSTTDIDLVNQDSETYFYNVGARGEFTPKLFGTFRVGYATREPEVGDSSDMIALDAGLTYAYSVKTQFSLDLGNDFNSSSAGGGQEVASVDLRVRSAIAAGITASASVGYQEIDYIGTNRSDEYLTFSLGVSYAVNQFMSLEASYTHLSNSSSNAGAEFDANILGIAANFRY